MATKKQKSAAVMVALSAMSGVTMAATAGPVAAAPHGESVTVPCESTTWAPKHFVTGPRFMGPVAYKCTMFDYLCDPATFGYKWKQDAEAGWPTVAFRAGSVTSFPSTPATWGAPIASHNALSLLTQFGVGKGWEIRAETYEQAFFCTQGTVMGHTGYHKSMYRITKRQGCREWIFIGGPLPTAVSHEWFYCGE